MIRYTKDTKNIVTLTLDMGDRATNIINHEKADAFIPVINFLREEKSKRQLKGVIITSAKKNFLYGGDLDYIYAARDPQKIYHFAQGLKKMYRDLEQPGVPIVAAINGSAMGSGYELALACHHRIVLKDQSIRLGHPEVGIGLMPNGGGNIRLLWLLGLEKSFEVLTSGRLYSPSAALEAGLVDEVASTPKEMITRAKEWIMTHQGEKRPWDKQGTTIRGGNARSAHVAIKVQELTAQLFKETKNNYPAPQAILNTLVEGSLVDFDTACRIESRYFAQLASGDISKNMIKAFWYDLNKIKMGDSRPKGFGKLRPRKVGIVGAGKMGSSIAYNCLIRNIEVVLKDISKSVAARGKDFVESKLNELVALGKRTEAEAKQILDRLIVTDNTAAFETCHLVIEAVFENYNLKTKVIREAEQYLDEYAFLATNTLSIPISKLALSSSRPEDLVGLHFFAPAHEVPLVEIVKGEKTSDETIARAFDFARAIRKIPIIVKDNWGFYAARVQNTYILEGISLLQEGYAPALVENIGLQIGMPYGPLALADHLSMAIVIKYEEQASDHYGKKYVQHPAVEVAHTMLEKLDRPGERKSKGFYEYPVEEEQYIWQELTEHFPADKATFDRKKIAERLLFAQVIEALWCVQEKIVASVPEANLGSIYGWGFPAYTGGILQYINTYGLENFIKQCQQFEKEFGQRFSVPPFLLKKLEEQKNKIIQST